MGARQRYTYFFTGVGAVVGLVGTIGFHAWAQIAVRGMAPGAAFDRAIQIAIEGPFATSVLVLPFIGAGVLGAETAYRSSVTKGIALFLGLTAVLGWLFHRGYFDAEHALAQSKWTASALSIGFLPFISVLVLIVGAIVAGGLAWKFGKDET